MLVPTWSRAPQLRPASSERQTNIGPMERPSLSITPRQTAIAVPRGVKASCGSAASDGGSESGERFQVEPPSSDR